MPGRRCLPCLVRLQAGLRAGFFTARPRAVPVAQRTVAAAWSWGWLEPEPEGSAAELARASLIRDLTEDLGVNAAGVDVALRLLDQVHGLRAALRAVLEGLPPEARSALLMSLRGSGE